MYSYQKYSYQKYFLEKVKKYQKSLMVWPRMTGKSNFLVDVVVDYILNNQSKEILIITHNKLISYLYGNILSLIGKNNLNFKKYYKNLCCNNNNIKFISYGEVINNRYDFVFIDDVDYDSTNNKEIFHKHRGKILLLTSKLHYSLISNADHNGDFYVGVVPYSSLCDNEKFFDVTKTHEYLFNEYHYEYNHIFDIYKELNIEKKKDLVDVWGLKKKRRDKILKIKKVYENRCIS